MNQPHPLRLSSWARLVGLALLLGVGVLASLGLASSTAHAQPAATITVSTCDESNLDSAISSAASGDTITFGCSGTITLSQTLVINKNLTLDGSGKSVTLDGNNSVLVLSVNNGASFTLNALTIAHGSSAYGGGLFNDHDSKVSITNSTFANNYAQSGGGVYNYGTVSISNSTFANNSVQYGGGGLYNNGGAAIASISNSTFANNSAPSGGAGSLLNIGTMSVGSSIIASNSASNCYNDGIQNSTGYNLESGSDCGFTSTGDLQNTDPKLDPSGLQNNGGPTQTIALLSSSPAIDWVASGCPSTDQRGMTRPDDPSESTCDIGAYESYPPDSDLGFTNMPANITTNAASPQGAVVSYTPPTARDESGDSSTASVTCTPASGSTFAIGMTTVTCTATDSDDTNSPVRQSFTVTVKGAATQIIDLMTTVNSFHLSKGLQDSLDAKLNAALKAVNAGQTATACSDLSDFIGLAQSQSGKGLTVSQANQLIAAATNIRKALGC